MLLRDLDTAMPEQERNLVQRYAGKQEFNLADTRTKLAGRQCAVDPLGTVTSAMIAIPLRAGRIVASVNAKHVPPTGRCSDARPRALYDYCTIRANREKTAYFQGV